MTPAWPRNIVPYTEDQLRALGSVPAIGLYVTATDRPLVLSELRPEERAIAETLVKVGLLTNERGVLAPLDRHHRDPDGHAPAVVNRRVAVTGFAHQLVSETARALAQRGTGAHAAMGIVTLPERPETIARATAIIAEAEDQLRALAEETPMVEGDRCMRATIFLGSMP